MRFRTFLLQCIPRFRIRTLLITTAFIAMMMPSIFSRIHLWLDTENDGIVVSGDASYPGHSYMYETLQRSGKTASSRAGYHFTDPITEYVDEPVRIPVFGYLQRHHKHYVSGAGVNHNKQLEITVKRSELRWTYYRPH